jgi:flagellar M-ring protein FliF
MSDAQLLPGAAGHAQPVTPSVLQQLRSNPRVPMILTAAAAIAVLIVLVLWSRQPDYKVLYSNLTDRDGGAIITALQQMNVPYQFSDNGGAILVPSTMVNDARLRLAQQGLPKGGSVGFELMDGEKFGISQFAEQINYQRALEGELERTIGSIGAVQAARVHLAIPKPSVFVREQRNPSASVLLNLYPGRVLDDGQVSAIAHMVASGVPDMPVKNVTIVDQNGNLLTSPTSGTGLDATQLKYVKQIEYDAQQRVQAILVPLYGSGNIRAQVSADIDFSQTEQTAESYAPNPTPASATLRSQQISEASDVGARSSGGVPGALSNAPPQPVTAPITVNNAQTGASGARGASAASGVSPPMNVRRDVTTNYEVNKTILHTERPMGGVKRLSVAVVVNYLHHEDAAGKSTSQPLTPAQLAQTEQLVKDAIGFDAARGDVVNVVNSAFSTADERAIAAVPLWKQPDMIEYAKLAGKYALIGGIGLYLFFGVLRPTMRRLFAPAAETPPGLPAVMAGYETPVDEGEPEDPAALRKLSAYDRNLTSVRAIAKQDPKVVATVVKNWVADER